MLFFFSSFCEIRLILAEQQIKLVREESNQIRIAIRYCVQFFSLSLSLSHSRYCRKSIEESVYRIIVRLDNDGT